MNFWLAFILIWFALDLIIMAGVWYATTFIKPRYPQLWQHVIVHNKPDSIDYYK